MDNRDKNTRKVRLTVGLLFAGMGTFIVLMAAGVFPSGKANAPMWVGALAGLAFLFAGLSVAMGALTDASSADGELTGDAPMALRIFQYLLSLGAVATLASVGSWVAFGAGDRKFNATIGFWTGSGNEIIGRVAFGFGAILIWSIFAFFAVRGARKLFAR